MAWICVCCNLYRIFARVILCHYFHIFARQVSPKQPEQPAAVVAAGTEFPRHARIPPQRHHHSTTKTPLPHQPFTNSPLPSHRPPPSSTASPLPPRSHHRSLTIPSFLFPSYLFSFYFFFLYSFHFFLPNFIYCFISLISLLVCPFFLYSFYFFYIVDHSYCSLRSTHRRAAPPPCPNTFPRQHFLSPRPPGTAYVHSVSS